MSLVVYAIAARGFGRAGVSGITGERLLTISIGALEAIVGEVGALPRPTEQDLRRYDGVIAALWQRSSALLPARFGTRVRNRAELELTVQARQQTLGARVAAVRNRAQMTVRIVEQREGKSATRRRTTERAAPRTGTEYLRGRALVHDVAGFAPARAAVRKWIRDERIEKRDRVATIYHLVPRSAAVRYRRAIERAAARAALRMHVSGPWPAYAFAESW